MKIVKVYSKGSGIKPWTMLETNNNLEHAQKMFLEILKEEHAKISYEFDIEQQTYNYLIAEEDYDEALNLKYDEIINKCMNYALSYNVNEFGDYKIMLVKDDEEVIPDTISSYTFYFFA